VNERTSRVAAAANAISYDEQIFKDYIDTAPHLKHSSLRDFYARLIQQLVDTAKAQAAIPEVLDLGAGEGSATQLFLEAGAKVTAVDISTTQLDSLRERCAKFGDRLSVRCEDINDTLTNETKQYDIVVTISFLHHVPDVVDLTEKAIRLLKPHGQFFAFQDPLRYDSLTSTTRAFSFVAFYFWRIFKGDLVNGMKRFIRRRRGEYDDSVYDNAEYHVVRNGVDQDAIARFVEGQGFHCQIVRYFSTQNPLFQSIGAALGMKNTFAVIAQK
jgi:2-polyprenyl-3-methyl-5-hydroxy-6-metoxy-1,4-benzoquinol methylase